MEGHNGTVVPCAERCIATFGQFENLNRRTVNPQRGTGVRETEADWTRVYLTIATRD